MKIIYILLINLIFILSKIIGNDEIENILIHPIETSQSKIDYLTYKISEQEEEILDLSERVMILHEKLYQLIELQKTFMTESDVILLLKQIMKDKSSYLLLDAMHQEIKHEKQQENQDLKVISLDNYTLQKKENLDTNEDIYNKGLSLTKKKQYNSAVVYFQRSITNSYKIALSLFNLGEIFFLQKEFKKAFLYFKKCIRSSKNKNSISSLPEDILYLHLGISLYKLKQVDKANNFFKYVIRYFPNSRSAREAYLLLKNI